MSDEKATPTGQQQITRIFEQPPDAVTFYADMAQVVATENEVILQFYDVIPGPPGPKGQILNLRTRLRTTVTLGKAHARNIATLLLQRLGEAKQ